MVYPTSNRLTVKDVPVHRALCKQKQTPALCVTNGERNTKIGVWNGLSQQIRLEHFEIISVVIVSGLPVQS